MSEDAPVTSDGDDERQQHADDDKEDGVVVGGSAVPKTLLSLGVEMVWRPAEVVWWVEGDAGQPRGRNDAGSATTSEYCVISGVPADVQVTVDCDERDGEQGHDTADDAEAGCSCTQPLPSIQQLLLPHHCTFDATMNIQWISETGINPEIQLQQCPFVAQFSDLIFSLFSCLIALPVSFNPYVSGLMNLAKRWHDILSAPGYKIVASHNIMSSQIIRHDFSSVATT